MNRVEARIYQQEFRNLLVVDVETASIAPSYEQLPQAMQGFWEKRVRNLEESPAEAYDKYAALSSEFAKVISIGLGVFSFDENKGLGLRVKSIEGHDEQAILAAFKELIEGKLSKRKRLLAHNGKEFDYPLLCRRMLIQGLSLPTILLQSRTKPWEYPHIDTMELWRFGEKRSFVSLRLLAHLLGLPAYADAIEGSMVSDIYHQVQDLSRIAAYCRNDVITTAQVYLRLQGYAPIEEQMITEVT